MFTFHAFPLILSLLILALGPVLMGIARHLTFLLRLVDSFIFVAIAGLVLVHVLPHSFHLAGWWALIPAVLGLFGPGLAERWLGGAALRIHMVALALAMVGLMFHGFLDGMGLAGYGVGGEIVEMLPLAILLHRLPEGLTIWWLLSPAYGRRLAAGVLALVGVATLVGFVFGGMFVMNTSHLWLGLFQALVGGSLMHVILHRPHLVHHISHDHRRWHLPEALGFLAGMALLCGLAGGLEQGHATSRTLTLFFHLMRESAPALLVAYVMAVFIHAFLPQVSAQWLARGSRFSQAVRGVAFGLPVTTCSCGVVPLYKSLVARGVSATAALAFFISAPELGLDAILLSIPLLGGPFTVIRLVAAVVVSVLVAWLVAGMIEHRVPPHAHPQQHATSPQPLSLWPRLKRGMVFGLGEAVDQTAPWIVLGLILAAAIESLVWGPWLSQLPRGLDVILLALVGIPLYVCASGATPLVAVLLMQGVSPGAALAFLLTGPATNVTTFGMLARLHGRAIAIAFGVLVLVLATGLGFLVNGFFHPTLPHFSDLTHNDPSGLRDFALVVLSSLFLFSIFRNGPRGFVHQLFFSQSEGEADPCYETALQGPESCCG